jgi:4-amino-4-deoxychorismate lyase
MTDFLVDGMAVDVVPADDRGLLYGDLLFETMAFSGGQIPLWAWHWQRLKQGCEVLGLALPDPDQVRNECLGIGQGQDRGVIRLTVTRGSGGRAYWPPERPETRRIVQFRPWPEGLDEQRQHGLELVTSPIKLASDSPIRGLKHGNRLEQVLAARACAQLKADEALVYDSRGRLAEAIAANVLVEIDDLVISPEAHAGVNGVGLAWLRARVDQEIQDRVLTGQDIRLAQGIMVINSVTGIRPARSLDGRRLQISNRCRAWQQLWSDELSR